MVEGPTQDAPGAGPESGATHDPGTSAPAESPLGVDSEGGAFAERPELFVGGAFVGGLALAIILRRVSR
jgi:hypothetical protein